MEAYYGDPLTELYQGEVREVLAVKRLTGAQPALAVKGCKQ